MIYFDKFIHCTDQFILQMHFYFNIFKGNHHSAAMHLFMDITARFIAQKNAVRLVLLYVQHMSMMD